MSLRELALIAAVLTTTAAAAQTSAPPAAADTQDDYQQQKRDQLACDGPFAKSTSHAKLAAAFGAKNVTFREVDVVEGAREKATVLFDDDPTKRIVVLWHDGQNRARPSTIRVMAPSLWLGPGGIGNGMKLTDFEKLNGKPFKLTGFDWDGGGFVRELTDKLRSPSGGCTLTVRFEPGIANPLPARYAEVTGDKVIASTNKLLRRTRAQVSEWSVGYPK